MIEVVTVFEQIIRQLRRDIFDGVYRPGEKITVKQIADKYNVSGMPVREAFQHLHGERLIRMQPYTGTVVIGITREYIHDIFDMSAIMQAEFGIRALSSPDYEKIHKNLMELVGKIEKVELREDAFVDLDTELHGLFLMECGNETAFDLNSRYLEIINYFTGRASHSKSHGGGLTRESRKALTDKQHRNILKCFELKDSMGLRNSIFEHFNNVSNSIVSVVKAK